jgi:WD40 repeat protein
MTEATFTGPRHAGTAWLTVLAAILLAVTIATLALRSSDPAAPTVEPVVVETDRPPEPQGIITYEITGKGYFTARASGEVIGPASPHDLHSVHNAGAEDSVSSPDGSQSVRIDRNEQGVFLAVGAPGAEQSIGQIAGPSDAALVAGGKGAARAVEGIPLVVAWSPDSKRLAYGSITGEPWTLHIMSAPGYGHSSVAHQVEGGYVGELAWSPDGRYLAISTYSLDRRNHTVLMLDTTTNRVETVIDGCHLTWSPDSRFLAIHRDPGPGEGAWIISPDGETRVALNREQGAFPYTWREG